MQSKYPIIPLSILVICIAIFGFTYNSNSDSKSDLVWSERTINWEDFEIVDEMEGNTVALIYSTIAIPKLITDNDSKVYAYMNRNFSSRLPDKDDFEEVLAHEQYHFNITEYCARLLRKEIVQEGLGGLSSAKMKAFRVKYDNKLDSLQDVYDNITDHSTEYHLQRFWELKVDDLLRQTAYYENEDIYSYYDFTNDRTQFYRHLYFTFSHKILTSYPVAEKDIQKGKTYELEYISHKEKVVKFYQNGKLTNGGLFDTAITKILSPEEGVTEIQYFNADGSYNTNRNFYRRKSTVDNSQNRVDHFFNESGERITKGAIDEIRWKYNNSDDSYYSSYYSKNRRLIADEAGVFHEKRKHDEKGRSIFFAYFDRKHRPTYDKSQVSKYEQGFTYYNKRSSNKMFDKNGDFAYHLNDYNLAYKHDERGNIIEVASLDKKGNPTYDRNGASIYEYTYDLYDRETSVKRYNTKHEPIVADDDYFMQVKKYDTLGRLSFNGYYYPDYVLKFTDGLWGATTYEYESDTIIKESNTDAYGEVFENNENIAIIKKHISPTKKVLQEIYLDENGNYAKTEDAVTSYKYEYNEYQKQIKTSSHDSLGNLIPFDADVAIIRWNYDSNGNKVKTTYFNTDNELAYTSDSITFNVYKYNKENLMVERTNFDIDMKPAALNGVFKKQFLYNKMGLDSILYEYNVKGKLKDQVAITKYFYNQYGDKRRIAYYNSKGRRTTNNEGISAKDIIYNQRQYRVANYYYDVKNRLTNNSNNLAIEKWDLNDLGHTKSYQCFDKNQRPVIGHDGYHKLVYEWSDVGETSRTAIYDEYNQLIEDTYGTAVYEYDLRPSGLYSEIKRYNKENALANNTNGVAITKYEFSLNGLYYTDEKINAQGEVVIDSLMEIENDLILQIKNDSISKIEHISAKEIIYDSITQILNDSIF